MSNDTLFLQPRLTGERFQGHAIPLELLKDLATLEEMVIEVAKWRYLQEHPERQRTPRGFTEGISLVLTHIDEGSAVPQLCLRVSSMELFPPANQTYFEQAREHIIDAINAAEHDRPVGSYLPASLLGLFDRIGRGLREGETIELNYPDASRPARLNKLTRRRLLLASEVQELTEEVCLRGTIPEADQAKMTFDLQMRDDLRVRAPLAPHYHATVLDAFNGWREGVRVLLRGIGRYSRFNRLQSIETVEHISLLDANDIAARLDELRTLRDGWLDGKGLAPPAAGLDWLLHAFDRHYADDLPLPYLYPTAEGGVQAEWTLGRQESNLEIDLVTRHGEWHSLNLDTQDDITRDLSLDQDADWRWLVEQIRSHAESAA